nr:RNA-directed DNA polymerase, eukaryota [Tanacetum cinerariifolium]
EAWKDVVDKVNMKLSKWKMKALSIGGQLTLLKSEIRVLSNQSVKVLDYMRLKLRNGDMAAFWADKWSGKGLLRDLFPRLYALENDKLVSVCSKLNEPHLDVSFRRTTMGGAEQVQFNSLLDMISSINLVPIANRWVWTLENSGDFSVASIREKIDEKILPIVCSKTRWVGYVPIKVNVLAWKIKIDALPTRQKISRRGIDIQSITCPVCDNGVESLDHLFFRCRLARQISRKIATRWNVQYVEVDLYEEWLVGLLSSYCQSQKLDVETVNHIFFNYDMARDLWSLLAKWWELDIPICANITDWYDWLDDVRINAKARLILEGVGGTFTWSI